LKDNYEEFTKDLIFMANVNCLSAIPYQYQKRIEIVPYSRPGSLTSSHIKIIQTKARNDLIQRLTNTLDQDFFGIVQLNGLYGIGKSYTLADFVIKSRVQTLRQLENRDPRKRLNIFVYLYLNQKDEDKYLHYFREELIYACYPLIKNELDYLTKKIYEFRENVDYDALYDTNSLINLLFSLFEHTYEIPNSIFDQIKEILRKKYGARLVIVLDQINEIKIKAVNSNENQQQPTAMKYLYDFVSEKTDLVLIQSASNNNEYTRDNYIKYLNRVLPIGIYV
jgi:hypothetical protein